MSPGREHLECCRWLFVLAVCVVSGCSDSVRPCTLQIHGELIYGDDGRRDVYAVDSAEMARIAVQSTVAFVSVEHLVADATGSFEIVADSLAAANNLCEGEAFEAQPAAATCSGVLIDDRLVLTAGHCIPESATCGAQLLVFGYAITAPAREISVGTDALYRCKSIPARAHGTGPDGQRWDFGFIELDRPVDPARRPVALTTEVPEVGSPLTVIGYPSGLPVKVDSGAEVLYDRGCGGYFTVNSDTFQASSGSGVFDELGRLVGTITRGGADYEFVPDRGCAVARRIAEVTDPSQAEQAGYLAPALDALCAAGWASDRLCAGYPPRSLWPSSPAAPSCRSGILEPDEATGGCSAAGRSTSRGLGGGALAAMLAALATLRRADRRSR